MECSQNRATSPDPPRPLQGIRSMAPHAEAPSLKWEGLVTGAVGKPRGPHCGAVPARPRPTFMGKVGASEGIGWDLGTGAD